jgi:hypothetical protein
MSTSDDESSRQSEELFWFTVPLDSDVFCMDNFTAGIPESQRLYAALKNIRGDFTAISVYIPLPTHMFRLKTIGDGRADDEVHQLIFHELIAQDHQRISLDPLRLLHD